MFNRKIWFLFFYFILLLFVVYSFVYSVIVWNNRDLYNLFNQQFMVEFDKSKTIFNADSRFLLFYLPIIGTVLAFVGFIAVIISQSTDFTKIKITQKLWLLIASFSLVMIGFFISFVAQLFYNQWDNSTIKIIITQGTTRDIKWAIYYYHNWFNALQIWVVFGSFFGIFVLCLILIVKLYLLNQQWFNYLKKDKIDNQVQTNFIPRYKKDYQNLPFNPQQSKTITIILESKKEHKTKKPSKKAVKSSKIKKK